MNTYGHVRHEVAEPSVVETCRYLVCSITSLLRRAFYKGAMTKWDYDYDYSDEHEQASTTDSAGTAEPVAYE